MLLIFLSVTGLWIWVEEELLAAREPEKEPGDEPLTSEDEEWTPSLREKLQQEANSEKHQLTHFPKNRYCEICRRAKMTAKVHRKRGLEIDPEETPPLHFGHKLRADHMITGLSKGSDGESCCLVVLDDHSGAFAAYPQAKRDTDSNIRCLQHFGGTRAHGKALCQVKTDCAEELKGAVEYLGWHRASRPFLTSVGPKGGQAWAELLQMLWRPVQAIHEVSLTAYLCPLLMRTKALLLLLAFLTRHLVLRQPRFRIGLERSAPHDRHKSWLTPERDVRHHSPDLL